MIQLIASEAEYSGGLFPKIPNRVNGQDTLLVTAEGIARKVDDYLTIKDIRKGNYNKVVRVSTAPFPLDVKLKAVSKNKPYEFDVAIGVECRVKDSVAYYTNKTTYDISSSISTALSRQVSPLAKMFELTDDSVDDALLKKLSNGDFNLESLGISFTVHSAGAEPASNAASFVKQMTDSTLNVRVEKHKASEAQKLTERNMESAIMTLVASNKIDMKTALETLSQSNRTDGYNKLEDIERLIEFVRGLQEKNLITDDEAGQRINDLLRGLPSGLSNADGTSSTGGKVPQIESKKAAPDTTMDDLLPDEERGE